MEPEYMLKSFLDKSGKLTAFPARRKKKIYCLFYLAQKIQMDRIYDEWEINELLLNWHTFGDPAALRRELCDYGFLKRSRDGKIYRMAETLPVWEDLV